MAKRSVLHRSNNKAHVFVNLEFVPPTYLLTSSLCRPRLSWRVWSVELGCGGQKYRIVETILNLPLLVR